MRALLLSFVMTLLASVAQAQIDQTKEISTFKNFGEYQVHYNVFSSMDIPPSVAQTYHLVRGDNRAILNLSLTKMSEGATSLGLPAVVSAQTRNLMQQKQNLSFIEIKEGDATYYLAPFVFDNEELLHFDVQVKPDQNAKPFSLTFDRTLYK